MECVYFWGRGRRKLCRFPAESLDDCLPLSSTPHHGMPCFMCPHHPPPRHSATHHPDAAPQAAGSLGPGQCRLIKPVYVVGLNLGSGLFVFYLVAFTWWLDYASSHSALPTSCKMENSNRNQTNCFFTFVTSIHPASTPAGKYFYLYFRSWIQLALFNFYMHNTLYIVH